MAKEKIYSIVVGVDFKDSKKAVQMAEKSENIFCSIGQHPVDNMNEVFEEEKYQEILDKDIKKNIVCIGECGLDYF